MKIRQACLCYWYHNSSFRWFILLLIWHYLLSPSTVVHDWLIKLNFLIASSRFLSSIWKKFLSFPQWNCAQHIIEWLLINIIPGAAHVLKTYSLAGSSSCTACGVKQYSSKCIKGVSRTLLDIYNGQLFATKNGV